MSDARTLPPPRKRDVSGFFTEPGERSTDEALSDPHPRRLPGPPPRTHDPEPADVPDEDESPLPQLMDREKEPLQLEASPESDSAEPKGSRHKVNVGLTFEVAEAVRARAQEEGITYTALLIEAYGEVFADVVREARERHVVTTDGFVARSSPSTELPKGRTVITLYLFTEELTKIDSDVERLAIGSRSELIESLFRHHLLAPAQPAG